MTYCNLVGACAPQVGWLFSAQDVVKRGQRAFATQLCNLESLLRSRGAHTPSLGSSSICDVPCRTPGILDSGEPALKALANLATSKCRAGRGRVRMNLWCSTSSGTASSNVEKLLLIV
jgi:hypothetical protein